MKIAMVMGTRPEIIKLAPIMEGIPKKSCTTVFTGQHYEYKMGLQFFDQLGIRRPDHALVVARSAPAAQTGQIMIKLSGVLREIEPDAVLVQGDTNTALAGAICSLKMGIPVCHVEAGLRSFDWRMPEEHNRIVADHISELLFAPTNHARLNLRREGVHGRILVTGNTSLDSVKKYSRISAARSSLDADYGDFILLTLHRAENVDDQRSLRMVVGAICDSKKRIIFPVHPRTRKRLKEYGLLKRLGTSENVTMLDAVGYFEMLELMKKCTFILTDSGGIQEEATAPQILKKTFVIRKTTDRPEAVRSGFSRLVGVSRRGIAGAIRNGHLHKTPKKPSPYGDGNSAARIISHLRKHI